MIMQLSIYIRFPTMSFLRTKLIESHYLIIQNLASSQFNLTEAKRSHFYMP